MLRKRRDGATRVRGTACSVAGRAIRRGTARNMTLKGDKGMTRGNEGRGGVGKPISKCSVVRTCISNKRRRPD